MNHIKALVTKFIVIALVLFIVLTLIFNVPAMDTLWISLIVTLLAYVLGDLMIFRKAGRHDEFTKRNGIATTADIGLAFLLIWWLGDMMTDHIDMIWPALLSAVAIGGGEWLFFHKFMDRVVFGRRNHENVKHPA